MAQAAVEKEVRAMQERQEARERELEQKRKEEEQKRKEEEKKRKEEEQKKKEEEQKKKELEERRIKEEEEEAKERELEQKRKEEELKKKELQEEEAKEKELELKKKEEELRMMLQEKLQQALEEEKKSSCIASSAHVRIRYCGLARKGPQDHRGSIPNNRLASSESRSSRGHDICGLILCEARGRRPGPAAPFLERNSRGATVLLRGLLLVLLFLHCLLRRLTATLLGSLPHRMHTISSHIASFCALAVLFLSRQQRTELRSPRRSAGAEVVVRTSTQPACLRTCWHCYKHQRDQNAMKHIVSRPLNFLEPPAEAVGPLAHPFMPMRSFGMVAMRSNALTPGETELQALELLPETHGESLQLGLCRKTVKETLWLPIAALPKLVAHPRPRG